MMNPFVGLTGQDKLLFPEPSPHPSMIRHWVRVSSPQATPSTRTAARPPLSAQDGPRSPPGTSVWQPYLSPPAPKPCGKQVNKCFKLSRAELRDMGLCTPAPNLHTPQIRQNRSRA